MAGDLIMLLGSGEALRAENWKTEKLVFSPLFSLFGKDFRREIHADFQHCWLQNFRGCFLFSVNLRRDLDGGQKKAWLFLDSMEGGAWIFPFCLIGDSTFLWFDCDLRLTSLIWLILGNVIVYRIQDVSGWCLVDVAQNRLDKKSRCR